MKKLTFKEISEIIKEYDLYKYLFAEDDYYLEDLIIKGKEDEENVEKALKEIGFDYIQVDYVCNTDEMFCVIYFKDSDIYIKLTGEYDSYGQYDHEYHRKITQVFPKEIKKIIYE